MGKRSRNLPVMVDLDARFRVMDEFGDYSQVISLASPPIESFAEPGVAAVLAEMANDGMAEMVAHHRDRFPAFVAAPPMNDPDAAMNELDRALTHLGAVGVQL